MSTQSSTNTTPTFSSTQSGLQSQLAGVLGTSLSTGGMTPQLQTEESGAIGATNNQYAGLSQQLQASLSGRGFGSSGAALTGSAGLDVAKINSNAGTQSQFAGLAQQNLQATEGLSNQFGFADPGSDTTKTTSALSNLLSIGGLAFGLATMGGGGGGGLFGSGGLFGGGSGSGEAPQSNNSLWAGGTSQYGPGVGSGEV